MTLTLNPERRSTGSKVPRTVNSAISKLRTRGEWPVSGLRMQHLDWSVNGRNGPRC